MNHKDMIISTLKGEPTGSIPFIPRLDIWYNSNKKRGTLPQKYQKASLREITDDLGLGYHSVIPHFRDFEHEDDDLDIGLGIYIFKNCLYKVILHNVERTVERSQNGSTKVVYKTPYGKISTAFVYSEDMKKSGATLSHITEPAIKDENDLKAAAYIYTNAQVVPDYVNFKQHMEEFVGDRGVAVGFAGVYASAVHLLQKELMSIESFFYALYDYPELIDEFDQSVSDFCDRTFRAAADSPAQVILSGANYDSAITTPPFFKKYITPHLKKQADILKSKGKFLMTHTDGENDGLLDEYIKGGVDIADSVCPSPMTSLSLGKTREVLKDKVTIWGGIPSVAMLENTMSDRQFDEFLENTLIQAGRADHLILGIADTTPPGAKFERILKIAQAASGFGPVRA